MKSFPPYDLPFSHNTSVTDDDDDNGRMTTDDRRQSCHKLDRYLSTVG